MKEDLNREPGSKKLAGKMILKAEWVSMVMRNKGTEDKVKIINMGNQQVTD